MIHVMFKFDLKFQISESVESYSHMVMYVL